MGSETQIRGTQIKDKSVKHNDTDFSSAPTKSTIKKVDFFVIVDSESSGNDTSKIPPDYVVNFINDALSLPKYQISDIVGTTKGTISLYDFVGTTLGSYEFELDIRFSELSNSNYRLTAHRLVKFSFTVFQYGSTIYHTEPDLFIVDHTGTIVKLSDQVLTNMIYKDITIYTGKTNNLLSLYISNNLGDSDSSLPAANGSIKAIYTLKLTKFNFV